jgi:hypothetical protein
MSETARNSQPVLTRGQMAWKVLTRVALEALPPGLLALGTAWLTAGVPPWTSTDGLQTLSGTFVAFGMIWGVLLRSYKTVTDSNRHEALTARQADLSRQMKDSAEKIAGYATGGSSFPMLVNAKVKDFPGVRQALVDFEFKIVGEYALHDVRLKVWNRDAVTEIPGQLEFERYYVPIGSMLPDETYEHRMEIVFFEGKTNRIDLSWRARNGAFFQRFEVRMVDGELQMATFVTRGGSEIYSANLQGYDCDGNGRPLFDMSPSRVDDISYFNR